MNKPVKSVGVVKTPASASEPAASIPVNAASSSKPAVETAEKYEKRIAKMSDKQLVSEIHKQKKALTPRHIQYKLCDILLVMMDSKKNGMTPYLRG